MAMLKSPAVWAIAVAHFVENWGFYTWLTQLPSFMTYVLDFQMDQVCSRLYIVFCVVSIMDLHCGEFGILHS